MSFVAITVKRSKLSGLKPFKHGVFNTHKKCYVLNLLSKHNHHEKVVKCAKEMEAAT